MSTNCLQRPEEGYFDKKEIRSSLKHTMEIFHANNSAVHPIDVGLAGPADGLLGEVANIGKKIKGVGPHAQQLLNREADEVEDFISSVSTTVSDEPKAVMTKA